MLSTSAFNALLKTIEEPPPYCIFIFATTEIQKVPATIKSRCQQFNFRLVPIEKVKQQLAEAANELGIKAEDEALYWIARESTGSMRDSYTLFDQVAAFSGGEITYEKIRDKLGLVGVDRLNEIFGFCVKKDSENALLKLDEYLQNGVSIEQLISNCADYLRSILLIKNGIKKESLLGQSADRFSKEVLDSWNSMQTERALGIFMQLYRDVRYSLSPRYEFELAVSRLCWLKDYVSAAEVKKAIDAVKPILANSSSQRKIPAEKKNEPVNINAPRNSFLSVPAPIPTFSALEEDEDSFYDGGAEPPEKFSAEAETNPLEQNQDIPQQKESVAKNVDTSDIEKVKDAMISDFSIDDALLASSLMQTKEWKLEENKANAISENQFEQMQIQQQAFKISEYLSKIYGRTDRKSVV